MDFVQVKTGWGDQSKEKEKTNVLVRVKQGWGDQPKEKRKRMD